MHRDQVIGVLLTVVSIAGILVYIWAVFLAAEWIQELVLRLTGTVAVGGVLGILAWIGYTLATTPPPKPIEEIEKEIEEELKKLEKELKEEEKKEEVKEEKKEEKAEVKEERKEEKKE